MEPAFWRERWQRAEIGFHQQEFNPHLQQFWSQLELQPGQRVFVPLCGKSRDLLWLAGEGHPMTGVELSPLAVEAFFVENGLHPHRWREGVFEVWEADDIQILCGDFFALEPSHLASVAGVYDRAALIALPSALRERYVHHLCAILPTNARTLLVTLDYDPAAMTGPPFAVNADEVQALYAPTLNVALLHTRDALAVEARWRERGLAWARENVYRLTPQHTGSS